MKDSLTVIYSNICIFYYFIYSNLKNIAKMLLCVLKLILNIKI